METNEMNVNEINEAVEENEVVTVEAASPETVDAVPDFDGEEKSGLAIAGGAAVVLFGAAAVVAAKRLVKKIGNRGGKSEDAAKSMTVKLTLKERLTGRMTIPNEVDTDRVEAVEQEGEAE